MEDVMAIEDLVSLGERKLVEEAVLNQMGNMKTGSLWTKLNNALQRLVVIPDNQHKKKERAEKKVLVVCQKIGLKRDDKEVLALEMKIIEAVIRNRGYADHSYIGGLFSRMSLVHSLLA